MAKTNITIGAIVPGAFYQGVFPGGFTDAVTGIKIPGPIVELDKATKRQVVRITEMPDPVQVPHFKRIVEVDEKSKRQEEIEVPFDRQDADPLHDALVLALNTGNIRQLSDEEVKERYPKAWAARREKIVFDRNGKPAKPMSDLLDEFYGAQDAAKKSNRRAKEDEEGRKSADSALVPNASVPPPNAAVPPPPPPQD